MKIHPDYKMIIGNQVPVFSSSDTIFFETNNPIYLNNKTATVTNKTPLITGTTVSKNGITGGVGGHLRFETGRAYDGSGNLISITYDERVYPTTITLFQ